MKTSELSGAALNWAVAKCEGIELIGGRYNRLLVDGYISRGQEMMAPYTPSNNWAQGGPIIERERIELEHDGFEWWARIRADEDCKGSTPLIAAMRCYIASTLGEKVTLPDELMEVLQ